MNYIIIFCQLSSQINIFCVCRVMMICHGLPLHKFFYTHTIQYSFIEIQKLTQTQLLQMVVRGFYGSSIN